MSPPSPQPKHFQESRPGVTVNDGVFSPWNRHRPLYVVPAFFSWTVSPTTSTTLSLLLTSAATPTAKPRLPAHPIGRPWTPAGHASALVKSWQGGCAKNSARVSIPQGGIDRLTRRAGAASG